MLMQFFDDYARSHTPYKGGAWCYEDGLVYRGLECLHRATGAPHWLEHLQRLIGPQLLEGPALAGYDRNDYNIDNIFSGKALLYLHEVTGQPDYLAAAALLADQLATHPRTRSGVYWHKLRYPWQIWLDGLYMGPPFQIGYGLATGDARLIDDALTQVSTALDAAFVPETGLYAHAVDEAKRQPWADPATGQTRAHWARAIGWLAMALVDVAELVGPERFAPLKQRTRKLLARIAELRQPGGLWLQVIDAPDLEGNYTETSASAMFTYALARGAVLGLYDGPLDGLLETLEQQALTADANGVLRMTGICHVAGLGMYEGRFRDGTAAYYISEQLRDDDVKGVGPLMMAVAAERERSGRTAQSLAGQ
ncbi:glycoside hydrolase family 88/105 protein [Poseidonocella sedimentorum]|uniref:Unsaturated rhamnogalacturonyl hydrolase n=1 Tax=Poseidonocella sedimentorum TaxID=871652 RepID=A0A1I6EPP8_9RHOB|nr:glycoside hydrolase family 88 protein [Poseidonocella sedimentorum]SFR19587.1 unsaturated rhamnogalacturonyl hydrolase [Poseidonocella sedimentorum]